MNQFRKFVGGLLRKKSKGADRNSLQCNGKAIGGGDVPENGKSVDVFKEKQFGKKGFFKRFFRLKRQPKITEKYAKNNMLFGREISSGTYGTVAVVKDKNTGLEMAFKFQRHSERGLKRLADQEAEIAKELSPHPLFLDYYGDYSLPEATHSDFYLYMEYVKAGWTLDSFYDDHQMLCEHFQFITWQLAEAMSYLHSKEIVHRDIKPDNILVNSKCLVKLIDFGLAGRGSIVFKTVGTPDFMAPEVRVATSSGNHYGNECDLFSLGSTLYYIVFNKVLDLEEGECFAISSEEKEELESSFFFDSPEALDGLLDGFLQWNPKYRLCSQNVLSHPFFHNIDDMRQYFSLGGINAIEKPKECDPWCSYNS